MEIDRKNYETILVDYLDGKLSPDEEAELMLFLLKNPDIAEEFEGLEEVKIDSNSVSFPNKSNLKKHKHHLAGIDNEVDYLCIGQLEGDLNIAERKKLEELISIDKNIRHINNLFSYTKLKVPHEVIFPNKRKLKHTYTLPVRKTTFRIAMSVAASLAIMLAVYKALNTINTSETIAKYDNISTLTNQNNSEQEKLADSFSSNNNVQKKTDTKTNSSVITKTKEVQPIANKIIEREVLTIKRIQSLPANIQQLAYYPEPKIIHPIKASHNEISYLPAQNLAQVSGTTKEYTLSDIAKQGLKKMANSLGITYEIKKNDKGKIEKLSIDSNLLAFSTTKNKND